LFNINQPFEIAKKGTSGKDSNVLNKNFVSEPWSDQEVVSIFEGEWASQVPGLKSGSRPQFDDDRIKWLEKQCGGFSGKSILELGPMEGGNFHSLHRRE
jgi:hypothetical protein